MHVMPPPMPSRSYAISSLAMSHALLSFLEQVAAFWTQRASGGPGLAGRALCVCVRGCACRAAQRSREMPLRPGR